MHIAQHKQCKNIVLKNEVVVYQQLFALSLR
jgi:hypothetical protein